MTFYTCARSWWGRANFCFATTQGGLDSTPCSGSYNNNTANAAVPRAAPPLAASTPAKSPHCAPATRSCSTPDERHSTPPGRACIGTCTCPTLGSSPRVGRPLLPLPPGATTLRPAERAVGTCTCPLLGSSQPPCRLSISSTPAMSYTLRLGTCNWNLHLPAFGPTMTSTPRQDATG
jgi:hypothetical protein